jgi:ATP diphosphatase
MTALDELLGVMARLRDPEQGCPWDCQQDFRSIVPHTLEEAYEVADAIEGGDRAAMRDELGDLLFQVVFYAQLGREEGAFDFESIARGVTDKLIRRHPHVFGAHQETTAAGQRATWEAIKAEERRNARGGDQPDSALDDIPLALPALTRSRKLQSRAARVGFDWPDDAPVVAKIREELAEVEAAMAMTPADDAAVAEEIGDLLLACVNLARRRGVDPEQALRAGNAKFERRFRGLEAILRDSGQRPEDVDFDTLESAYQRTKAAEAGDDGAEPTDNG